MIILMKRVILICLFISLLASIAPNAAASGDFQAKYDVQYDVLTRGSTIVTQNITLTNLQTNLYPQKYSILIDSLKIQNVIAYDPVGPIHPQILDRDGRTEIILEFNEKVIGLGKQLTFTLRYEDEDITRKNGSIWEITIPGIANNTDIDIYDVRLNVPQSFGPVAYMSPLPLSNGKWNKSQMISGGISIAYGTVQSFDTDLAYTIENTKIGNIVYEIALPPDTAYQKVFLREISPKPQNIKRDDDGNWMAQYNLYPTQKVIVHAKLVIQVSIKPFDGYTESLTNRSVYIKPEKYWESTDPKIKEIALQNKTARDIYRYVV